VHLFLSTLAFYLMEEQVYFTLLMIIEVAAENLKLRFNLNLKCH
jgi:hypothetical protein